MILYILLCGVPRCWAGSFHFVTAAFDLLSMYRLNSYFLLFLNGFVELDKWLLKRY